jgi:hypothetical protein
MVGLCVFAGGCSSQVGVPPQVQSEERKISAVLYQRPLELRALIPDRSPAKGFLILYATGDGGWRGLDEKIFELIGRLDYSIVGFSSKSYLNNLGYVSDTTTTTPRRLARDYLRIIEFAESTLSIPTTTRVILIGNSRGAGLSVVAAGQEELKPQLAGIIAVALTKEEEHVVRYRRLPRRASSDKHEVERVEIKTYEYLPQLAQLPVEVIQSEHDGYLPAAAARTLFGPDTDLRRLHPVSAKNHSFRGGRDDLLHEMETALSWISGLASPPLRASQ